MNTLNSKPPKTIPQRLVFGVLGSAMCVPAYWLPNLWASANNGANSAVAFVFLGLALLAIVCVVCAFFMFVEAFKKSWL